MSSKSRYNRGTANANWMGFGWISKQQCISLSDFSGLEHFPRLWRFPFLERLELRNMPTMKELDCQPQHLKELYICVLEGLEELWGSDADAGQWHPHLRTLEIWNCPKLELLPSLSLSIRKISLNNLGLVSLPTLWLDRGSTCITSDSLRPSSSLLEFLEIINCGKITSLGKGLLQLQHHLTALIRLRIWYCPELVDFPSGGLQHLWALKDLWIANCPKLQVAPDANGEMFLPPSLRQLRIVGCDELLRSLRALLKGLVSLDELHIEDSEELMSLEGLMGLQSVRCLAIRNCPKFVNVAAGTSTVWPDLTLVVRDELKIDDPLLLVSGALRSLTSIRKLHIMNCEGMKDMSILEQWLLQNYTTLEELKMFEASSLESLPHSLKNLSFLNYLVIFDASEGLVERCRKVEGADWPNISHIPDIYIEVMGP